MLKRKAALVLIAVTMLAGPSPALAQAQRSWLEIFCESSPTSSAEAWAQYLLC
jgi:hypothetical protein